MVPKSVKKTLIILLTLFMLVIVPVAQAMDILVLGLFKDMAILRIDDQQRKLKVGETSPEGVKLISADSEQAVLEINNKRDTYKLGSHVSASYSKKTHPEAKIWPTNGMYMATGSINGHPMRFLIDTGATWVSMNANHARRLGIDFRVVGKESWVSTANGTTRIYVVTLNKVKLDDIELHNVTGAVHEGGSPPVVLLGMSFLNRVDMQRKGQMMLLKKKW